MKTIYILIFFLVTFATKGYCQEQEIAQLLLNVEKLTQFKRILSDMKDGYKILEGGYNTVKDISEGNFNIHKQFLDGLMQVSPTVRKYRKVSMIIEYQIKIIKEYKTAFAQFKQANIFRTGELTTIETTYTNVINQSLRNLDELTIVISSGKLRMSDDERINAIDRIFEEMEDKLMFVRHFNKETALTVLQRQKEKTEIKNLQNLYKK
ncbi:MAG: TerB family tellurite resistance protein [Sphingobacterium sp.]|uniref:TerB family tellurite resistance protein n=1 Tax=Sphingobacterium sp. TaxID=341027 RepID=UPI0028415DFA|nr:TerB family tellurite resistance protein [Sphingobacterium sp.]MDR3008588.1 TerB family tellurite resistance protein [Sphingobacterium sp.]